MASSSVRAHLAGAARRHGAGLAAIAASMLALVAVLTDGTFELVAETRACCTTYYDVLADRLREGRFDVTEEAIGPEAFVVEGRTYGYFGPTPALGRMVLNALFPAQRGEWARVSLALAALLSLLAAYALHRQAAGPSSRTDARARAPAVFVLATAGGTTLLFLMWRPVVFHEASAVAAALSLASGVALLRYLARGRPAALGLAMLLALLAHQARGSVGLGPILALVLVGTATAMALLFPRRFRWRTEPSSAGAVLDSPWSAPLARRALARHAAMLALVLGTGLAAIAWKNVATIGTLTGAPPLSRHVQVMHDPERLARTGGEFIQPANLRTMLFNYLSPTAVSFQRRFPGVFEVQPGHVRLYPEARLDHLEGYASLTATSPFWCLLALLGTFFAFRPGADPRLARFRVLLAGTLAAAAPIFVTVCITQRYLHDLFPFLVAAGAVGWHGLAAARARSRWARALVPVLALALAYTLWANASVSLTMDRWD